MVSCTLIEVFLTGIPSPIAASKLGPVVKSTSATPNPGVVVETTATTKSFTSGVWLLNSGILRAVDEGSLIRPIPWTGTELESTCGSSNFRNFLRVSIIVLEMTLDVARVILYPIPASMTRTDTFGFSASLPATTLPAVPPILLMSNLSCLLSNVFTNLQRQ